MKIVEKLLALAITIGIAILCALGVVHYSLSMPSMQVCYVIACAAGLAVALLIVTLLLAEFVRKQGE